MFMRRVRMMGVGGGARPPPSNEDMAKKYGIGVKTGKKGADITNINQMLVAIFPDIAKVWKDNNGPKPFITSGTDPDPKRVKDTDHKDGMAIDLRANNISNALQAEIAKDLQEALGEDYWVNPEYFDNIALDHIHISYRPKTR